MKLDELEKIRLIAYDNALIYKEIIKRYHGKHIVRRNFEVGHQVLLYNFLMKLFPRKLKSKWSGLFLVHKVFANGAVKMHDSRDAYTLWWMNNDWRYIQEVRFHQRRYLWCSKNLRYLSQANDLKETLNGRQPISL